MKKIQTFIGVLMLALLVGFVILCRSFWFTLFVIFCLALTIEPEKNEKDSTTKKEVR
jgi:hypothetical protein